MILRVRKLFAASALFAATSLAGCFTAEDAPEGCEDGAEGCQCFTNQTCLTGLMCQDQVCVAEDGTGGPSTTAATMSTTDSTGGTSMSTTAGVTSEVTTTTSPTEATTEATVTTVEPTSGDSSSSTSGSTTEETGGIQACTPGGSECPVDEKCNPWSDGGGDAWNAFGCFPVDRDPVDTEGQCAIQDSTFSGIDNCVAGSVCWDANLGSMSGACNALCEPVAGTGCDPDQACFPVSDGFVGLCLAACDPLLQDCPEAMGCYFAFDADVVACAPDASGGGGGQGEGCDVPNGCDPGLACVTADFYGGGCASERCCSQACDLSSPACSGGQQCNDVGLGPGLEETGICGA